MPTSRVSRFQLDSALAVARLIDEAGNDLAVARLTYTTATTDGRRSDRRLMEGEDLLLAAGLLATVDGRLIPQDRLRALCELPADEASAVLLLLLPSGNGVAAVSDVEGVGGDVEFDMRDGTREDRREIGMLGERHVLHCCKSELEKLGRPDLARQAQRVSLISDALGYDVFAPTVDGRGRKLEVKTQSGLARDNFRLFLTRNEYEVGRRNDNWAVVCCDSSEDVRIIGWCKAIALSPYLPVDRNGRWTEALVHVPLAVLHGGLPDCV